MTIVAVRPKPRLQRPRCVVRFVAQPTAPVPADDTPCRSGPPFYPGGTAVPLWVWQELGLLPTARGDRLPPTPEQLTALGELNRTIVPSTRAEARALILGALEGETDEEWWVP